MDCNAKIWQKVVASGYAAPPIHHVAHVHYDSTDLILLQLIAMNPNYKRTKTAIRHAVRVNH